MIHLPKWRDAAALVFAGAGALEPANFESYLLLGLTYTKAKKPAEATVAYRKAVELSRSQLHGDSDFKAIVKEVRRRIGKSAV